MSTPRIYRWDDFGSPGGVPPGSNLDKLKAIFKACLVDGYGDQPAAGWEMVHEHPNGFSITNGDGVLNVVSGAHGHPTAGFGFYIAQEVTDTSEALIGGVNLRSNGWIPELSLNGAKHALYDNIGWKQWVLIANNKSVTFYNAHGSAPSYNYYEHALLLSFGEPKGTEFAGNFFCTGNTSERYRQGSILNNTADNILSAYICTVNPSGSSSGLVDSSSKSANNIFLQPAELVVNNYTSGTIPGVVHDAYYTLRGTYWSKALDALGLKNDFWGSVGKPVNAGGYELAYLYGHSQSFFITTDPRFW